MLTVLPWFHPFGLSDWADNYFLLYAAQKTGLRGIQHAVSSGWFRGAVTGLGILNLLMAAWEVSHFKQTVRALEGAGEDGPRRRNDEAELKPAADISHNERVS